MTGRNFAKARMREQMARRGYEGIRGGGVYAPLGPSRRRQTKAELRAEAEALITPEQVPTQPSVVKRITCSCGHAGRARLAPGGSSRLRCSECSKVFEIVM